MGLTAIIFCPTLAGFSVAQKIKVALPHSQISVRETIADQWAEQAGEEVQLTFDKLKPALAEAFLSKRPIIAICATGIVVRSLASYLKAKEDEAPVLVISQDGKAVIPLLGGHKGANKLAGLIGGVLNVAPAITTASDLEMQSHQLNTDQKRQSIAVDDLPLGYCLEASSADIQATMQKIAQGRKAHVSIFAGGGDWPQSSAVDAIQIAVDDGFDYSAKSDVNYDLVIRPETLAVGFGCERNCPAEKVIEALEKLLEDHGYARQSIAAFATIDIKGDEALSYALEKYFQKSIRLFTCDQLEQEKDRLKNPSKLVFNEVGCYGVSEASALALAGQEAELVIPKVKGEGFTLAIAKVKNRVILPPYHGRSCGQLSVVGIGPGSKLMRTSEMVHHLLEAEVVVGYRLYLDQITDLTMEAEVISLPLGEEVKRAEVALREAAKGKRVALVSSGDAGIFGLATLVFELVDQSDDRSIRAVRCHVIPGISSFQAAASRIGAPFNHDFACLSLSDLLTPRDKIIKRIKSLAEGDFVTALYNPQSLTRRELLPKVIEVYSKYRPANTPVILARNLCRDDEEIIMTTLQDVETDKVDMLTLVIIGNSQTRYFNNQGRSFAYSPRGYIKN